MKILLVEDDPVLGESLSEFLSEKEIDVKWISDDRKIEDIFSFDSFDVIILDLMLKYKKGEQILKRLRNKGVKTPVLILTAKNSIEDKKICFNFGADDYLTKPFNLEELILRLQALNKRQHINEKIKIGDIIIDLDNKMIYKNNKELKISKTAWDVLYILVKNKNKLVNTETILNYVWGDKPVGDEIVRTYIKELRKILPSESIQTYKGRGYKLVEI